MAVWIISVLTNNVKNPRHYEKYSEMHCQIYAKRYVIPQRFICVYIYYTYIIYNMHAIYFGLNV